MIWRLFRLVVVNMAVWLAVSPAFAGSDLTTVRVGWASRALTAQTAPFAVAIKMGWFREEGLEVELMPLAGSADCVKNVATRAVPFALASPEPLAVARLQGLKAKTFYTAYQGNIFVIAVPANSPIEKISDLKGRTIGVPSMGSTGVPIARALVAANGLNPDTDVSIVPVGEAAQAAAMLRNKQVDALSQGDTQHAIVEIAGGIKLRLLDNRDIARFPSDGFVALEATLQANRKEAVGLARGYAMGTVFALANSEAAVRILYEVWPQTRAQGKDEASALRDDVRVLEARLQNLRLERSGAKRWGENFEANYTAYIDFLFRWGIIKEKVAARDLVTYSLIDDINRFDAEKIAMEAGTYRPK